MPKKSAASKVPAHLAVTREELAKRKAARATQAQQVRAYDDVATLLRGAPRTPKGTLLDRLAVLLGGNKAVTRRIWEQGIPELDVEPLWALANRLCPEIHPPSTQATPAASRSAAHARAAYATAAERVEQAAQQAAATVAPELASAVQDAVRSVGGAVGEVAREHVLAHVSAMTNAAERIVQARAAQYEVQAEVLAAYADVVRDELALARNSRKASMAAMGNTASLLRKMPDLFRLAEAEIDDEVAAAQEARAAGVRAGRLDVDATLTRLNRLVTVARNAMALSRDSSQLGRALMKEAAALDAHASKLAEAGSGATGSPDEVEAILAEVDAYYATLGDRNERRLKVIQGGLSEQASAPTAAVLGEPIGRVDLPTQPERP